MEKKQMPDPRETRGRLRSAKNPGRSCNVLFVSPDNSCTSIMAEALMKHLGGASVRVFSAGKQPSPAVHPLAAEVLKGRRIWREYLQPKSYQCFLLGDSPTMDFVIGVGERWPDGLPSSWPGSPRVMQWHISEPSEGSTAFTSKVAFSKTLTELETRIRLFILILEKDATKRLAA